ncbi:MAG TPA: Lrp/AsnC family transcriptional regulator [Desulfobacteraceae bacterium]|nr:Lrp/AsnC family transcriptional regulator [Deltaproteobacteria bacterium]MBW2356887.1 Lrp/AsnC family transcriptional regulator [Deltaproteobacteria bacterium]RLB98694.1 MAG: Lrp/AsnC family transcriptional regulator [Deltaproteobacteria bacterium]HDI59415.1 Lrp/AsnC family transcriptional regulator [Desulfobacteraceae bacterium]
MARHDIDAIDKAMVDELSRDGRRPVGQLAKALAITPPTVRSRLRALTASGLLRIAALLDAGVARGLTVALVGICLDTYKLDAKLEEVAALDQVHWAAVVTGKYDIMAEVVSADGMAGLHRFLSQELYKIGEIKSSETFVVMTSRRKWLLLPPGLRRRLEGIRLMSSSGD